MTTTADVDARGQMAAAELHAAVANLRVPTTLREGSPRKRRMTLAFAALLLVGAVLAVVIAHDDAPTKLTTAVPAALPRLVPTYVPDGSAVYRTESVTPEGMRFTTTLFASTPRQVRGRAELMVTVRTMAGGFNPDIGEGTETIVHGHDARTKEYSIDNGETLRAVWWLEDTNTWVDVQSATMDSEALVSVAEALQIADGAVANQVVGGLSVLLRRSSPDQHETRALTLRDGQPEQFLYISAVRSPNTAATTAEWLPGREVDVQGHKAWLSHEPIIEPRVAVAISWSLSSDVRVSVVASGFSDDEVLRVVRSLRDVSQSEWDALPTQ